MANFNLNKVILGGRLTSDVELKQTQSGIPVCSFSIAVNRHAVGKNEADFFTVTAWRQTAEFVCRYFKKGSSICVIGSLQNRSWEKNGEKRTVTEIVAEQVEFVDSRAESGADGQLATAYANAAVPQNFGVVGTPKFEEIATDADLPF